MTSVIQTSLVKLIDQLLDLPKAETEDNVDMDPVVQDPQSTTPSSLLNSRVIPSHAESCFLTLYGLYGSGDRPATPELNSDCILNEEANNDQELLIRLLDAMAGDIF